LFPYSRKLLKLIKRIQAAITVVSTMDAYDPVTENPEFKACAVRVEGLR
jgi:hypothetical protein